MLKLLVPAGNPEAVIAAVQRGADIVYIGFGLSGSETDELGFSSDQLLQAVRYCRARGCSTMLSLSDICSDTTLEKKCERAVFAAKNGVDALCVQDLGLIRVLRNLLPDMPLWGDAALGITTPNGAKAAEAMGISCLMLPSHLSFPEIQSIAAATKMDTCVYVHGNLCFSLPGFCYMSKLAGKSTANLCANLCRNKHSLGGHLDDKPMDMKDLCLIQHLKELEVTDVDYIAIDGHQKSAEYISNAANLYSRILSDGLQPSSEQMESLHSIYSPFGLTDAFFTENKEDSVFSENNPPSPFTKKTLSAERKQYMNDEIRRIPVHFYVVIRRGAPALFAAEDNRGNRAVYKGFVPVDLGRSGISEERIKAILYRTGGTPYSCADVQCSVDVGLDYPEESVEAARKNLISQLSETGKRMPKHIYGNKPVPVLNQPLVNPPYYICQLSQPEQLTPALASLNPDFLYIPVEWFTHYSANFSLFQENGIQLVAVLPKTISEPELPILKNMLLRAKDFGVTDCIGGNFAYVSLAKELGMNLRGDYNFGTANSFALDLFAKLGLKSATLSFELSLNSIKKIAKPLDTELIVYGRLPVMLSQKCIIERSSGRCDCRKPAFMKNEEGSLYPVFKEFGCRNVVYDSSKIFLADKKEELSSLGLWALRLLFTTETPSECVEITKIFKYKSNYQPNNTYHGLYDKGVL